MYLLFGGLNCLSTPSMNKQLGWFTFPFLTIRPPVIYSYSMMSKLLLFYMSNGEQIRFLKSLWWWLVIRVPGSSSVLLGCVFYVNMGSGFTIFISNRCKDYELILNPLFIKKCSLVVRHSGLRNTYESDRVSPLNFKIWARLFFGKKIIVL